MAETTKPTTTTTPVASTSAESYYLAGKDAAAKEREQRLLAAKRKLKSYRARQAKTNSTASADSFASRTTTTTNKRDSLQSIASLTPSHTDSPASHKHRRSISKSALLGERVNASPVVNSSSPIGHARRNSKSRHSRGPSLTAQIAQIKGHSHQRSRSRASISISNTPRLGAPPQDGNFSDPFLVTSSPSPFARSTSPLPPGAKTPTNAAVPSVGWITNPFLGSTPAPEASTSKLPSHTLIPHNPPSSSVSPSAPASSSTHQTQSSMSSSSLNKAGHHERRASRHARQTSVSNFRESLEIVSGQGQYSGTGQVGYTPAVSSFAATPSSVSLSPSNSFQGVAIPMIPIVSASSSPRLAALMPWEADPAKVLEALKERGRRESDTSDPEQDRRNALEALEGRVAAPSEMIDLGNEAQGELLVAPKSPGYTAAGARSPHTAGLLGAPLLGVGNPNLSGIPSSPSPGFVHSPMIGLGVSGKRRDSWSAPGPVTAAGAKGAMDLGMLVEEEEEDEHMDPLISPRRRTPRKSKSRPPSLISNSARSSPSAGPISPPAGSRSRTTTLESLVIPMMEMVEIDESKPAPPPPPQSSSASSSVFTPRPLRTLSLTGSIISSGSPGGTPSTAAGSPPAPRQTPLHASSVVSPHSADPPLEDARTSPTLDRKMSMFHSAAVATANGHDMIPTPPSVNPNSGSGSRSPITTGGGLRSLSIGSNCSPPLDRLSNRSPLGQRRVVSGPNQSSSPSSSTFPMGEPRQRSSITYKTTSQSFATSPDASFSSAAPQSNRRQQQWRVSNGGGGGGAALAGYPFPSYGGFGDLQIDSTDDEDNQSPAGLSPLRATFANGSSPLNQNGPSDSISSSAGRQSSMEKERDETPVLKQQIISLQAQVDHLKAAQLQLTSTHALEMADFETKTSEETQQLRTRVEELESSLEEASTARRFEVEGLTREIEQAREAMRDVIEERDELREDIDGWRKRCAALESNPKKGSVDHTLAQAQAKLIAEMRDQIYNLVRALEQERAQNSDSRSDRHSDGSIASSSVSKPPSTRGASIYAPPPPKVNKAKTPSITAPPAHTIIEPAPVTPSFEDGQASRFVRAQHAFQSASDGSVLSTSSFGQSYSGHTTEGTSVDDSHSVKMTSSPPSHVVGFGSRGRDSEFGSTAALNQLQTLDEEEEEEEATGARVEAERLRHEDSGSTGSVSSVAMPITPNKEEAPTHHHRSHSFVRHWSFPKGSISSVRVSTDEEDHSFFDYNRHTSLPPLPLDAQFPPFVTADLTVEEDELNLQDVGSAQLSRSLPAHIRRPSSPRPLDRMNPHTRRFSGQFAERTPPVAPSALAHAQLSSSISSSRSEQAAKPPVLSRLSFGLIGSLSGWAPSTTSPGSATLPSSTQSKFSQAPREEDEKTDHGNLKSSQRRTSSSASRAQIAVPPPPMSSKYASAMKGMAPQQAPRYIKASEVKRPQASRLAVLNFQPACCAEEDIFHV